MPAPMLRIKKHFSDQTTYRLVLGVEIMFRTWQGQTIGYDLKMDKKTRLTEKNYTVRIMESIGNQLSAVAKR